MWRMEDAIEVCTLIESIAPEEVYPAELRDNRLIEIRSRLQMRSGGAQQKNKHIISNSAA